MAHLRLFSFFTLLVFFFTFPACSESLLLNGPGSTAKVTIPAQSIIAAEGDSLTWGADFSTLPNGTRGKRSGAPYPETLSQLLNSSVHVENRGANGDRTKEALWRWDSAPRSDLVLLMYGTNDFANFGQYRDGPLSLEAFQTNLRILIARRSSEGARVIVMLPPPLGIPGANEGLESYRQAARLVAQSLNVPFFDTALSLKPINAPWTDQIHLTAAAYRAIALDLAHHITVLP